MDFQNDIIDRSYEIPVVVDFWAPWCGPCRFLGPVLETMASNQKGRWELIKVNVDEHPELSYRFEIRGIPAVKLFSKGEVIGEFSGAIPRPAIEQWLDRYLPDEAEEILADLLIKEAEISEKAFIKSLKTFVKNYPDNKRGQLILAQHIIYNKPEKANELVKGFRLGNELYEQADAIRKIYEFMDFKVKSESTLNKIIKKAQAYFRDRNLDECMSQIIEANRLDKSFHFDLPRKTALALFDFLGKDHEITKKFRKKFEMVLY